MSHAPYLLRFRSCKAFLTAVVTYAVFVDQWVFAVIVPVMPFTLEKQVGIAHDSVQFWVSILLAVYGIACTLASPFWGFWIDRSSSRRFPFMSSLIVLFGATLMIWLGRNIAVQLVGRVLQGAAAAMVWITGLAMIADTVGQEDIGRYAGYLGIGMMMGTLIAPLVGGVVLAKVGQDAVFGITLGLIGIDIIVRFAAIERKYAAIWIPEYAEELEKRLTRSNQPDRALLAPTAKSDIECHHEKDQVTRAAPGECTSPKPKRKLPAIITLMRSRRLMAALWAAVVQGAIFAGFEGVLPLETEAIFGWDSVGGGLIFLPLTIPALLGPLVGKICDRYGTRLLISISFLAMCPILTMMRFVDTNSLNDKVLLTALLALAGCCFTATLDPLMAEMAYVVGSKARSDPARYGEATKAYAQAYALFNMAWSIGNTFGPLMAGIIREHSGWATMGWALGLVCGVTAVPTFLWCGGWFFGPARGQPRV